VEVAIEIGGLLLDRPENQLVDVVNHEAFGLLPPLRVRVQDRRPRFFIGGPRDEGAPRDYLHRDGPLCVVEVGDRGRGDHASRYRGLISCRLGLEGELRVFLNDPAEAIVGAGAAEVAMEFLGCLLHVHLLRNDGDH